MPRRIGVGDEGAGVLQPRRLRGGPELLWADSPGATEAVSVRPVRRERLPMGCSWP